MQTNAGEARGYLVEHISLPLLLFPPLYLTALYLISQKSKPGGEPLPARLASLVSPFLLSSPPAHPFRA